MGFLTMKSPFLQNINKANHAVDIFLRHHLQALEAGDASKLSQGHWVSLALHIRAFQALIRTPYHLQDYLEATKPTDIIPQPKKKTQQLHSHTQNFKGLPQETNNKKQEHLSHHQTFPKKMGKPLHDLANMVTHRCLASKFYSIHQAGCWGVSCWGAGCWWGRRCGWMKDLAKL